MVLRTGILFVMVLMSFHAQAEISYSMPAIELGMKINSVDHEQAVSNKQTNAYQGGLSVVINLSNDSNADFGIRTGLFYSERSFKNDLSNACTSNPMKETYMPCIGLKPSKPVSLPNCLTL